MFKDEPAYEDGRVLSSIEKPAWAFNPSVHPAMVQALRVHAQRSSLRSDGRTSAKDKQEISDLFQQPQPSMSDDIAIALGVEPSMIQNLPYSTTFGYLLRSIVTMVLKADGDSMNPAISSFLRKTLDMFYQGHGNLLTTTHPLKVGVLDEVQSKNSWNRDGEYVTLELLHNSQLCALLIPVTLDVRKRIEIEFNPNYKPKSQQFLKTPVVTTTTENVPMIYMGQDTFHHDEHNHLAAGNDGHHHQHSTHQSIHLHNNEPMQTHSTHSTHSVPSTHVYDTESLLGHPNRDTYSYAPHTEQYSQVPAMQQLPPMQPMQSVPPMSLPSQAQMHDSLSSPSQQSLYEQKVAPSEYSMQGFDAFNSILGSTREQTFPFSRMKSMSDSGAHSTPWNLRLHGNRFPANGAARLAGTAAPIKSNARWA